MTTSYAVVNTELAFTRQNDFRGHRMAAITATATFDGTTDTVTVAYTGITATVPDVIPGGAVMSSSTATPPGIAVAGNPTSTSCVVKATAPFVGAVNLVVIG